MWQRLKEALVIHCKLSIYAGAEYLCLYTCKVLQSLGYHVNLVSDVFDPSKVEELFEMGNILSKCTHIPLPELKTKLPSKLLVFERLLYTVKLARFAKSLSHADFAIVMSTQSSIFHFPGKKLYHFVYEITDLFRYPMPIARGSILRGRPPKRAFYYLLRTIYTALAGSPSPTSFFVTGRRGLSILQNMGYRNSSFFYPPSRVHTPGLPKLKQIVQASRIAPEKRLEFFFETAKKLSSFEFLLVGKNLPADRRSNPRYAEQLLAELPPNVTYVEATMREHPELVENSKVYFHTGLELGMLTILMEAMSAGCILVVPEKGVAGEIVRDSGIGYQYNTLEEAVEKLTVALEGNPPWTPSQISERAKEFGPDSFEKLLRKLIA